jgi:excisionase family DNA binding protein
VFAATTLRIGDVQVLALPDTATFLTTEQAAAQVQVHPRTIQRAINRCEIQATKVGGRWRIRQAWLDRWVDENLNTDEPGARVA